MLMTLFLWPGCESLEKLDLTVNFVGELTSIDALRSNEGLRELYVCMMSAYACARRCD